jgi:CHAT domain-containing protein/Tfp pilus assembly protein PilF
VATSLNGLANLYQVQGKNTEAEALYQRSLAIFKKVHGPDHPDVATSLNNLAALYKTQGKYAEAEPLQRRSLAIWEKVLGAEHPDVASSLNNLGNLYQSQRKDVEAEPLFKRSLAIQEKAHGPEHPDVAISLHNLAHLYSDQGKYVEAEPLYRRSLAISEKVFGPEHPQVATSLNNLGGLYCNQGKYVEAEPFFKRSLAIREKALGPEHPSVALSLNNLASLYDGQGKSAEAESLYRRSLAISANVFGFEHPDVARSLNNLAILYKIRGKYAEAELLYRRSLAISEKVFGPEHPSVALSLNNLASLYDRQGKYAEAELLLDRAIQIEDRASVSPGARSTSYASRAKLSWKQERKTEALADLKEAMRLAEDQRKQFSGAEQDRAQGFAGFASTFETMVAWRAELGDVSEAFSAAERSRAQSLRDQMASAHLDLLAGLPQREATRLRQWDAEAKTGVASLQKQLELLQQREGGGKTKQQRQELQSRLKQARDALVESYRAMRNASPAYRLAVGRDKKPVDVKELQDHVASSESLLLQYYVGVKGSYLFVIGATDTPSLLTLTASAEQAKQLGIEAGPVTADRFKQIMTNNDQTGILELLRQAEKAEQAIPKLAALWQLLIPQEVQPLITEGKYQRLIIVPDGSLSLLPFETLVVSPDEGNPTYLLDVGPPIQYAPSATILYNLTQRPVAPPSTDTKPVLTVGDPAYGEKGTQSSSTKRSALSALTAQTRYGSVGGRLRRLPYSGTESDWIVSTFEKQGIAVGQLKGKNATEANIRYNVTGRKIIHLACHGLTDQAYGNFFGALALTPGWKSPSNPEDDGFLTLPEIYRLQLKGCELSILSACQTNYGPQQKGEGVWALSRGFLVAGSRRVVASNWLVDDEAAASLISYFCGGLALAEKNKKQPDYAKSLHAAKKWVRDQEDWASPYYWGTFVLVGPN